MFGGRTEMVNSQTSSDGKEGSKLNRQRKESKRPDMAIYRPGQSRLMKKTADDDRIKDKPKNDGTKTIGDSHRSKVTSGGICDGETTKPVDRKEGPLDKVKLTKQEITSDSKGTRKENAQLVQPSCGSVGQNQDWSLTTQSRKSDVDIQPDVISDSHCEHRSSYHSPEAKPRTNRNTEESSCPDVRRGRESKPDLISNSHCSPRSEMVPSHRSAEKIKMSGNEARTSDGLTKAADTKKEHRWLGPQGRRKPVKGDALMNKSEDDSQLKPRLEMVLNTGPEKTVENIKPVTETLHKRESIVSGAHHRLKPAVGTSPPEYSAAETLKYSLQETSSSMSASAKVRRPERPLYTSPRTAESKNDNVETSHPSSAGTHSEELAVETMIFTSSKPSGQSNPLAKGSTKAKSTDPLLGRNAPEKNRKAPVMSLLDVVVVAPKTSVPVSKSQLGAVRHHNAQTKPKQAAPSKRHHHANQPRRRQHSGSSNGSDTHPAEDMRSEDWEGEVIREETKLPPTTPKSDAAVVAPESSPRRLEPSQRYSGRVSQKDTTVDQKQETRSREEPVCSRAVGKSDKSDRKYPTDKSKLSVTFNEKVREVSLSQDDRSEMDVDKEAGNYSSGGGSGGIIRLKPSNPIPISSAAYAPISDKHFSPQQAGVAPAAVTTNELRTKERGRHANRNLLWDPSKPEQKPALITMKPSGSPELHFYDPEGSPGEAPGHDNHQSYGYGPFPQPATPHYQQPPPHQPRPAMSWAEQVEYADTLHQHPRSASIPTAAQQPSNYDGNFPLLGSDAATSSPPAMTDLANTLPPTQTDAQTALRILRDTVRYENSLSNASSRRFHGDESIRKIMKLRSDLERMYEQVLLSDLETCNKHNVEQLLWKNAYYQLIEALRRQDSEEPGSYTKHLMQLLVHGDEFYTSLVDKLQSVYRFSLETRTGLDPLREEPKRMIKLAILSAQRCMIALGDIARYKELTGDTNNYGKARSWYLRAQHLAPRNGRPYNQLAILALYTRRRLDSVYYYMRSLGASSPFLTARESLMSLFEEVRRKVEHKELAHLQAKQKREQDKESERRRGRIKTGGRGQNVTAPTRREVWIASDGSSHEGPALPSGADAEDSGDDSGGGELEKIMPAEVNKMFVLSLLNVHGKLFTKIGMEMFEYITGRLLREFRVLLSHSPTPVTSARLVEAMAMNMFAAHNTETQDGGSPRDDMRSLLQEQAVQLGLDMFGLLVDRCNQLLKDRVSSPSQGGDLLSDDLVELLPGVKVYADWLMCHPRLWNPPPNCTEKTYSAAVDVWSCLAELLNTLKQIDTSAIEFIPKCDYTTECHEILLPEDVQLSGFVPLLALPLQMVYVSKDTDKLEAMDCVRINSLLLFGEYACGQETPLLAYDVAKNSYVSVAPKPLTNEDRRRFADQEEDDVVIEEEYYDDDDNGDAGMTEETNGEAEGITGLRQKKEYLQRRLQEQQQKKAQMQAALDNHSRQRVIEVEIRPLYLVPDTNCFIKHLPKIEALLACRMYKLVVPLVVINELDGLAKGSSDGQRHDPSHAYRVHEGAGLAIACLEEKFGQRNKFLRALTSKGTIMDTIAYRNEETGFKGCNDDLILKCCQHYVEDKPREYMPADRAAPIRLHRNVVLLTNDRNLRLKALQCNMPVKDIIAFTKWAKV